MPASVLSASKEWLTPAPLVRRAVAFFGEIDLDPASEKVFSGQSYNVPARDHFTSERSGLVRPWVGRVWLNPPYGRDTAVWIDKLTAEYDDRHVDEALCLVPAYVDTGWWERLSEAAASIAFIRGRLSFRYAEDPGAKTTTARFPCALVYLGHQPLAFESAFSGFGSCYRRVR